MSPTGTHPPLITLQSVSKTFDGNHFIVENINLTIHEREFVIIFGPSGSGKSTLLNLMAGLEFPTTGQVIVNQADLQSLSSEELARYHRLKIGMVFQNFNLIKSLNVWENVALPQTAAGVPYTERKERALDLLGRFNLINRSYSHPSELSGGEQQRVAIARALINDPYVMLVDEPTGNLDSRSADGVMTIFKELHGDGHTIVLVTHNPNYLHFATSVVHIQDGRIINVEQAQSGPEIAATHLILPEKDAVTIGERVS